MKTGKYLIYILGFSMVSILMLVLIPGDPKNAVLLGFSELRLLMLSGFGLLLGVLAWGFIPSTKIAHWMSASGCGLK